jgi:hypothetical protein
VIVSPLSLFYASEAFRTQLFTYVISGQ